MRHRVTVSELVFDTAPRPGALLAVVSMDFCGLMGGAHNPIFVAKQPLSREDGVRGAICPTSLAWYPRSALRRAEGEPGLVGDDWS